MRLIYRIHEYIADHVEWVQYPRPQYGQPLRDPLSKKEIAWMVFAGAWVLLILISLVGNSLPD